MVVKIVKNLSDINYHCAAGFLLLMSKVMDCCQSLLYRSKGISTNILKIVYKTYKIIDVIKNYKQLIIVLDNNSKIPFVDEFIVSKDDKNKVIVMNVLDGLM